MHYAETLNGSFQMLFMLCMVINRLHLKLKWKLRFICAEGYWGTLRAIVCRWIWINLIAGLNCVLPSGAELPGTLNLIRKIITLPPNCSAFGGKHVSTVLRSDRHKHPLEPILKLAMVPSSSFSHDFTNSLRPLSLRNAVICLLKLMKCLGMRHK